MSDTRWPVWEKSGSRGEIETYLTRDQVIPRVCWDHTDPAILAERLNRQIRAAQMEASR